MKKLIHDIETKITRYEDFTQEEIAQIAIDQQKAEAERAEREAAEAAKESAKESALAKLQALGLTLEEVNAII